MGGLQESTSGCRPKVQGIAKGKGEGTEETEEQREVEGFLWGFSFFLHFSLLYSNRGCGGVLGDVAN
jgi:hypothetical protein